MRKSALLFAVALAAFAACGNPEACLAPFSPKIQKDLAQQCCQCLASNGTRWEGAKCAQAFNGVDVDGGKAVVFDDGDAGPPPRGLAEIPDAGGCNSDHDCVGDRFCVDQVCQVHDDGDGHLEDDEVPCLCEADAATQCVQLLSAADPTRGLVVTGACLQHVGEAFDSAPCRNACQDVINFIPVETQGAQGP